VEQHAIDASPAETRLIMTRGAQAIKKATEWKDPVDTRSIRVFLQEEENHDEVYDVVVEEKCVRLNVEDGEEPTSKRRPLL